MSWPVALLSILSGLTLCGLGCLALIAVYWNSVGRLAGDLWPKVIVKLIQAPTLAVTIGAGYATENKREWLPAAVAGACCIVVWEVVEKLIDGRVKAAERLDRAALERAEQQAEARTELLIAFRRAVNEKVRRLLAAVPRRRDRPSPVLLRAALTPETHLDDLLENLAAFFAAQLPEDQSPTRNFRVGLYVNRGGVMVPLRAVNLYNPGYNVFSSYQRHQSAFRLDTPDNPSHVVTCVRRRGTIIVEDCVAAAGRGEFFFFNDDQRGYLRSMLAYYLDEVSLEDGTMTMAALAIDTDAPGFFREEDRDAWEFCLREFGSRLKLELLLHAMLVERERRR